MQGYIARWYAVLWSAGVSTANWYAWDPSFGNLWEPSSNSGDVYCDGSNSLFPYPCVPIPTFPYGYLTDVGQAYQSLVNPWPKPPNDPPHPDPSWLAGKVMVGCQNPISLTIWTCTLQDPVTGFTQLMVWDSSKDRTSNTNNSGYQIPPGYNAWYTLASPGTRNTCTGSCYVPIGASPVLIVQN